MQKIVSKLDEILTSVELPEVHALVSTTKLNMASIGIINPLLAAVIHVMGHCC